MSHVVSERGAALAARSTLAYIGEFKNAVADQRLLGGPGSGMGPNVPFQEFFPSLDKEEETIFRQWLVSHDLPFNAQEYQFHRFSDQFWDDWPTPFWYFSETIKRFWLSQAKNQRRRTVVSHRV